MSSISSAHLVLDYRPSQATGWESQKPGVLGKTIGGHHSSREFKVAGRRYRLSLARPRAGVASTSPVYEHTPAEAKVAFKHTLEHKFGSYYSFRYRGGLKGRHDLKVESYSVFAQPKEMSFGAELYVVYDPDVRRGDPPAQAELGWIQVARWSGTLAPSTAPYVDGAARPNPFFISGGLTSILGTQVFNFYNFIQAEAQPAGGDRPLSATYTAEVFLARDTATNDGAGRDIIDIFGGITYGWQLQEVGR